MQNAFAFDWTLDFLSLGTTFLYRKYMIGTVPAAENEWRAPGGAWWQLYFDNFDEMYPDLVPAERLFRRWSANLEEPSSDVVVGEHKGLRIQVCFTLYNVSPHYSLAL